MNKIRLLMRLRPKLDHGRTPNHMDIKSIEPLNTDGGMLKFVSYDREFVSSRDNKIFELKPDDNSVVYEGTNDEYLASQGIK